MSRAKFLIGMVAVLLNGLTVPQSLTAGNGCGSYYFQGSAYYYPRTYSYYTPTYQTSYVPPTVCYDTPQGQVCTNSYNAATAIYNTPVNTFYRVAPDLASARIAQEASAETLKQFRAELQAQAEANRKAEAERKDQEFKATVLQLLAARGTTGIQPPSGPAPVQPSPASVQLEQENAQLRELLFRVNAELERLQKSAATPAPAAATAPAPAAPAPAASGPPPAPPQANAKPIPAGKAAPGSAAEEVKQIVATNCMPCHNGSSGRLNLTEPGSLYYEDLTDCINRIISDDPKFQMPPPDSGKKRVELAQLGAFHRLSQIAPHRPKSAAPAGKRG